MYDIVEKINKKIKRIKDKNMEKEVVIVVKKPKDKYSIWNEELQFSEGLEYIRGKLDGAKIKGTYTLPTGEYYMSQKHMEKLKEKFGKNLIVVLENVERLTRKSEDIGYLEKLIKEQGYEFYFWFDKTKWNQNSNAYEDFSIKTTIAYKEMRSKEISQQVKDSMKKVV